MEFHRHGIMPRGTNSSFISLIDKCENPQGLGDFRPISLVGCLYKILAKVLANRLKRMLEGVIDERQSLLLLLASSTTSLVTTALCNNCLMFDVDFEKAYDSVLWEFLFYMLHCLGLHHLWIKWIKGCLD